VPGRQKKGRAKGLFYGHLRPILGSAAQQNLVWHSPCILLATKKARLTKQSNLKVRKNKRATLICRSRFPFALTFVPTRSGP
jgi:hypothetical protein